MAGTRRTFPLFFPSFRGKGRENLVTILVLVILMSVVVLPFDVSAKLKTKSGTTKTFAFISTDGEVCSAKVYSTIGQNYTVSGNNATYTIITVAIQ